MNPRLAPALCAVAVAVALPLGCGSRPVVSGRVTYKQDVLTAGEISFVSADGRSRSAPIGPDGRYEIVDPPSGKVAIVVVARRVEPADKTAGSPFAGVPADKGPAVKPLVPDKYADPKSSGLEYLVVGGRQTKDVELD